MSKKCLRLLLVEDKASDRDQFLDYCDTTEDMEIVGTAVGCADGIPLMNEMHPDVVILDLQLSNGTGLDFLKQMNTQPLIQRPYVVITTVVKSEPILMAVREYGIGFELYKSDPDYGPQKVIQHLRDIKKFLPGIPYSGSYVHNIPVKTVSTEEAHVRYLRQVVRDDLNHLGIPPGMLGYDLIEEALVMLALDKEKKIKKITIVNKRLIRVFNTTSSKVTRNIRSAIEHAWNNTNLEEIQQLYPGAINPGRGNPTPKEFLFTMASKYRDIGFDEEAVEALEEA